MNITETTALLAVIAASDRRTVGETDVELWHDALSDLNFEDCRNAVRQHIRNRTDWMLPAHVRQGAKLARRERLEAAERFTPDADPEDVPAYLEARRTGRVRTGELLMPRDMRAIKGTFPSPQAVDVGGWRQRAQRMLPARRPAPADLTHAEAVADMDQMLNRLAQARTELAGREVAPVEEPAP